MTTDKHDPWALLAEIHELQPWLSQDADLAARVEAALAGREVQQAAFRRGAEAMREASAQKIERDCGNAQTVANWIRDLPIPEDKR
jgi:hypothetical protein